MELLIDESRILKANLQISPHLIFLQNLLASCNNFGLDHASRIDPLPTSPRFKPQLKQN